MQDKDFIYEEILSIEDFDNVDSALMQKICENEEYRRLFLECKELSELASECVPEPMKDGVSLKDSVLQRVKEGDIAPRYINTHRFRFPLATVASLIMIAAVLFVSKSGIQFNKIENTAQDSALLERKNIDADGFADNASFGVAVTDDSVSDIAMLFDSYDDAETEITTDFRAVPESSDIVEEPETQSNGSVMYKTYSLAESALSDSADATITTNISDEVTERLDYAKLLDVPSEKLISFEQVELLGEQNFIEWFDSIKDKTNFVELYSFDEFSKYCEAKN